MYVAIAGNIGAGKTTLARKIAQHYDWKLSLESVDDNPYLEDFYADMPRWAFHLQIYFLNHRFRQVMNILEWNVPTIQDRSIYEDAHIFAKTLAEDGAMDSRDYQNYLALFRTICEHVPPPDLLIYLKADLPKLKKHIRLRGRDYEQNIPDEYLIKLNRQYETLISQYDIGPLLVIDVNEKDFLHHPQDWESLLEEIDAYAALNKSN